MQKQYLKLIIPLIFFVFTLSCKQNPEDTITHITGYWEIEKVINSNNEEKNYSVNQMIDYFFVNDSLKGFRKKLAPDLLGGLSTSKDNETFTLSIVDDHILITYKTLYDEWSETITYADEKQMIIVNDLETKYIYKRFEAIDTKYE